MTRKLAMGALLVAAVAAAAACQSQEQKKEETKTAGGTAAMTEDEKTVYVIGLRIGGQATILHLSAAEVEALKRGVADAATGKKPEVDPEVYGPKVQPFRQGSLPGPPERSRGRPEHRGLTDRQPGGDLRGRIHQDVGGRRGRKLLPHRAVHRLQRGLQDAAPLTRMAFASRPAPG